ncbi:hypothetical protein NL676_020378 [Syzygium grande]|nr:hypothetical protein NL676_020378 [Syzygium grande]
MTMLAMAATRARSVELATHPPFPGRCTNVIVFLLLRPPINGVSGVDLRLDPRSPPCPPQSQSSLRSIDHHLRLPLSAASARSFELEQSGHGEASSMSGAAMAKLRARAAAMVGSYDKAPGGPDGSGQRQTSSGRAPAEREEDEQ